MGVDKSTGTDTGVEQVEDEQPADRHPPPPPDQPGQEPEGVPSRLEAQKSRAAAKEQVAEKAAEETDKKGPAEATFETSETDEDKDEDAPKPSQDSPGQLEQEAQAEDKDELIEEPTQSESKPETTDEQQGQDSDHEMPSYAGFASLAEEFNARAPSREFAKQYNTELAEDEPDETNETEISETPQDQGSSQDERSEADEPGSWRGERVGQYLNAEENLATDHARDRIQAKEPTITEDLKPVENETGGQLVGLENRLKGEDRFKEKVSEDTRDHPEISIGEIAESEHDAIRYTYQFNKDDYAQGYDNVCQALQNRGYEMTHSRNFWSEPEYKGINTRWRTPEGQPFEVQFHTPESFKAKQDTHVAYERIRNLPEDADEERAELAQYQRDVSAGIPVPEGVATIRDYRKEY